ncbi:hypothetical protein SCUCBS95973_007872 [Sporothrix curviconia]|uniref:Uncharacterized protein n=1 Tax=Sporothrix curviconia TaxID=1260050 RepID=A0ABP0CGX4_9PEZI
MADNPTAEAGSYDVGDASLKNILEAIRTGSPGADIVPARLHTYLEAWLSNMQGYIMRVAAFEAEAAAAKEAADRVMEELMEALTTRRGFSAAGERLKAAQKRAVDKCQKAYLPLIGAPRVIHPLFNHYPESSLCVNNLRGRDTVLMQALREATASLPVDIFLAVAEQRPSGQCELGGRQRHTRRHARAKDFQVDWHNLLPGLRGETRYNIAKLVDLDGTHIAEDVELSESDVEGAEDCFAGAIGKEIKFEEVIVDGQEFAFAMHSYCISAQPGSNNSPRIGRAEAKAVVQAVVRMRDWKFLAVFAKKSPGLLDYKTFVPTIAKWLEDPDDALTLGDVGNPSLVVAVLATGSVAKVINAIELIVPPPRRPPKAREDFATANRRKWGKMMLELLLLMLDTWPLRYADGKALASHFVARYDIDYIKVRLLPDLPLKRTDIESFLVGVATHIGAQGLARPAKERLKWRNVFASLSKAVVANIDMCAMSAVATIRELKVHVNETHEAHLKSLHKELQQDESVQNLHRKRREGIRSLLQFALQPRWLACFYEQLIAYDSKSTLGTARKLLLRIADRAMVLDGLTPQETRRKSNTYKQLWLPFLRLIFPTVLKRLSVYSSPTSEAIDEYDAYHRLYKGILDAYLDHFVGPRPSKNTRSRPVRPLLPRRCCDNCRTINQFLADHTRDVLELSVAAGRHKHIFRQLSWHTKCIDCRTDDGGWRKAMLGRKPGRFGRSSRPRDSRLHYRTHKTNIVVLTITKTGKDFEDPVEEWKAHYTEARQQLAQLARLGPSPSKTSSTLKSLLGSEDCDRILNMTWLRKPKRAPAAEKQRRTLSLAHMHGQDEHDHDGQQRPRRRRRPFQHKSTNPYRCMLDGPLTVNSNRLRRRTPSPNAAKTPLDRMLRLLQAHTLFSPPTT